MKSTVLLTAALLAVSAPAFAVDQAASTAAVQAAKDFEPDMVHSDAVPAIAHEQQTEAPPTLEPAAGTEDLVAPPTDTTAGLQKDMKLPRKN